MTMITFDHESVRCLECDEHHVFPPELLLYTSAETGKKPSYRDWNWATVLTNRIWCFQCEGPSYTERIPSQREFDLAFKFRSDPDLPRPDNLEDELLDIDDEQFHFLRKYLKVRHQKNSCICCGSESVRFLQTAMNRVVNFKHPLCGGILQFDRFFFLNGSGKKTIRWFSIQGEFVGQQNDYF
ncbi:hypothetical protein [Undibacterium luofuense]|uniref:Uncharacterized protein n=1 Tax=Undibacterium luofuense TaxID=2828733 RepID=A0A941DIN3_9BURK|nr:hypothetical protein [Undibacterium luofuense]MBR7780705.1 hypothetical protein [Undibacterium luofuense]